MKRIALFLMLTVFCHSLNAGAQMSEILFFVGTFTSEGSEGIYLCSFNPGTGELLRKQVFKGIDNPNFIRKSPDGKYLYVTMRPPVQVESTGGYVAAYRIGHNGRIEFMNKQPTFGKDPCYVDVSPDGRNVAVSNYGGGSVALFPVKEDGSLRPASSVVRHEGSGPHPTRQTKAFAHSIRFSPHSSLVYAADLGADKLFSYEIDKSAEKLVPAVQPFVKLPPGSGPRHFDFSKDGRFCYVVNELSSTIDVFSNNNDKLSGIQTIRTIPDSFTGMNYCADIHISPDGIFLYASNRGMNSIAVFSRDDQGKLKLLANVPTEGDWPRNFVLDPTGRYILAANQKSHNITVFRLDNGIPVFTGKELKIPAPVCLEFL